MIYSKLAGTQVARGASRPETTELAGRVRVAVIDTVVSEVGKEVLLAVFPAGRVRLLGGQSLAKAGFATATTTVSIGHGAYTDVNNTKQVAKPAALLAATAGSALADKPLLATGASGLLLETNTGFDLTATTSANLAVGDSITGVVLYVVD